MLNFRCCELGPNPTCATDNEHSTNSSCSSPCIPSTAMVRALCVATVISRPRARTRLLVLLCNRKHRSACLAASVCAPILSSFFVIFSTFPLPCPRPCLVFWFRDVGSAVPPHVAPPIFRLRSVSGAYTQGALLPPAFCGGTSVVVPWPLVRTV